jgi:hypothetical protein
MNNQKKISLKDLPQVKSTGVLENLTVRETKQVIGGAQPLTESRFYFGVDGLDMLEIY